MPSEAGWCPDPSKRGRLRYWNGSAWTSHIATDGTPSEDALEPEALGELRAPDPSPPRRQLRATIESMASTSKYRKPLREGSFANLNLLGGDWNEYANVALTAMLVETLLDIDQRLEEVVSLLNDRHD